eukprot:scaffold13676_cov138-Isochrysis_galbana.AAC.3
MSGPVGMGLWGTHVYVCCTHMHIEPIPLLSTIVDTIVYCRLWGLWGLNGSIMDDREGVASGRALRLSGEQRRGASASASDYS